MKHLKYTYKEVVQMKLIRNSDKTFTCPVCGNVSKNKFNAYSCLQAHVDIHNVADDLRPYLKTALKEIVSNSEFIKRYTNNIVVEYAYKPDKGDYNLDTSKGANDYAKAIETYEEALSKECDQLSKRRMNFYKIDMQKKADILSICNLGDKEIHYTFVNYLFNIYIKKDMNDYEDFFTSTLSFVTDMKNSGTF